MCTCFAIEVLFMAALAYIDNKSVIEKDFFDFSGSTRSKFGHGDYEAKRIDPETGTSVVLT